MSGSCAIKSEVDLADAIAQAGGHHLSVSTRENFAVREYCAGNHEAKANLGHCCAGCMWWMRGKGRPRRGGCGSAGPSRIPLLLSTSTTFSNTRPMKFGMAHSYQTYEAGDLPQRECRYGGPRARVTVGRPPSRSSGSRPRRSIIPYRPLNRMLPRAT